MTRIVFQPCAAASVGFMDIGEGCFIHRWEEGFNQLSSAIADLTVFSHFNKTFPNLINQVI